MSDQIEAYRLARIRSTPYPNRLLERSVTLPETQLRIVNLVVRATLGWKGGAPGTRRSTAYFRYAYLMQQVERSSREAVSNALVSLIAASLVEAVDDTGQLLSTSTFCQPYRRGIRLRIGRLWVEEIGG